MGVVFFYKGEGFGWLRSFRSLGSFRTWVFRLFFDYFGLYAKIVGMQRYLEKDILEDLKEKIVLLTGPRQTGKTTLSKMFKT